MESYLIFYLMTLLAAASLLYTWFNSSLPCLLFYILKLTGLKSKDNKFWIIPTDEVLMEDAAEQRHPLTWTAEDFDSFAINRLPIFLSSLITCRYCLCYHIVFWINLFAYLLLLLLGYNFTFILFLACIMSQPILVHILYNITDKLK